MAIYRPPKARWPLATIVGVLGLLAGLGLGLVLGGSDPSPEEAGEQLRSELLAASGSLDVAAIEYGEAVEDGRVTKEAEYEGAQAAVASSRTAFENVRAGLALLAPDLVERIEGLYAEVESLMGDVADPDEVEAKLEELQVLLKGDAS